MKQLRISGLVRLADGLRRELAAGVTAQRKAELQQHLSRSLTSIRQILTSHRVTIDALPAPSRNAYAFLTGLDLDAVPVLTADADQPAKRSTAVALRGLPQDWRTTLQSLSLGVPAAARAGALADVVDAREHYAGLAQRHGLTIANLSPQSAQPMVWLALFSQPAYFDRYCTAVADARAAFEAGMIGQRRFRPPARVEFRPIAGYWRIRSTPAGTEIGLPTAMICLDADQFRQVAGAALQGGTRQPVAELMASEACQTFLAEWDSAAGVPPATAGIHRDLAASFDRVNAAYFAGAMPRPTLYWNKVFTGRKFGHYDPARDAIMISCALDSDRVPEFVLDSVMHHELLHKKLGVDWSRGRAEAHTPQFRAEERTFRQYEEADRFLRDYAAAASR